MRKRIQRYSFRADLHYSIKTKVHPKFARLSITVPYPYYIKLYVIFSFRLIYISLSLKQHSPKPLFAVLYFIYFFLLPRPAPNLNPISQNMCVIFAIRPQMANTENANNISHKSNRTCTISMLCSQSNLI